MADLIQIRRDTKAHWAEVNPVLALGEPGLETDTRKVKYGNGITAWNNLSYSGNIDIITTIGTDLDIADDRGNVLARIAEGHIRTKNFDSSKNATTEERGLMSADDKVLINQLDTKLAGIEPGAQVNNVVTEDTTDADLNISDERGNILIQAKNGHIKTKNFDSANIGDLVGKKITDGEMDEVLGGDVAVYLTDVNGAAVLDDEGKPIEII